MVEKRKLAKNISFSNFNPPWPTYVDPIQEIRKTLQKLLEKPIPSIPMHDVAYDMAFMNFRPTFGSEIQRLLWETSWDEVFSSDQTKHKCNCDITALMSEGCKCGGA